MDGSFERDLMSKGYKRICGVDEVGRGCERPDAKILTKNGWKYYTELDIKDLVLSYTSSGHIEWQNILHIYEYNFKGELIELKGSHMHAVVTPEHSFDILKRICKKENKTNKSIGYRLKRVNVLDLGDNDYIPRGGIWIGRELKHFVLSGIERIKHDTQSITQDRNIPMELWVAFLGIYLAKGSVSKDKRGNYRINIAQFKIKYMNEIHTLLKSLPFKFKKHKGGFAVHDKSLYAYLSGLGNCYNKFIPPEIKELSPRLLNILVKWMVMGDGTTYTGSGRKPVSIYYTVSERLKSDLEEILLKIGKSFTVRARQRNGVIRGRKIFGTTPCFEIAIKQTIKTTVKFLKRRHIPYSGKVFCLELPTHHNFFVKRGGTGYFTGNSLAGPVVAAAVILDVEPLTIHGLNDSKKLSASKRAELSDIIVEHSRAHVAGQCSVEYIDQYNILQASLNAMTYAINHLPITPDLILIDGNQKIPGIDIPQMTIVKGDSKIASIAAASIVAKVIRDRMMETESQAYPEFGWLKNKGYGTKEHIEAIKKYGFSNLHRKSFAPIRGMIKRYEIIPYIKKD